MTAVSFLSELEVEEYVVCGIHKQDAHDDEQPEADRDGTDPPDRINRVAFVFEEIRFDFGQHRQAAENGRSDQEDVVAQRGPGDRVRERRAVREHADARDVQEELAELAEVLKEEDAEADDDDELRVDVLAPDRPLLHALFAELLLKQHEAAVVQAPQDVVPGGAVPHAGAEPDEEEARVFAVFAENRHVEQVVAEEGAERNVPALPELRDGLAHEGVPEVFLDPEAEQAAEADGDVRIAAEVEIHIQRVGNDGVPGAEHRKPRDVLAEERVDDAPQVVRDDDLFRKADDDAQRTLPHVFQRRCAVVDLVLNRAVADDRAGDHVREQGEVEQEFRVVLLHLHGLPVAVENVGDRLERVEADAERQRDLRHGEAGAENGVHILEEGRGVFEDEQQGDVDGDAGCDGDLRALFFPVFIDLQANEPVENGAEKQEQNPDRLAPGVENQRKNDEHRVFGAQPFSQCVGDQAQGQKEVEKKQIGK